MEYPLGHVTCFVVLTLKCSYVMVSGFKIATLKLLSATKDAGRPNKSYFGPCVAKISCS